MQHSRFIVMFQLKAIPYFTFDYECKWCIMRMICSAKCMRNTGVLHVHGSLSVSYIIWWLESATLGWKGLIFWWQNVEADLGPLCATQSLSFMVVSSKWLLTSKGSVISEAHWAHSELWCMWSWRRINQTCFDGPHSSKVLLGWSEKTDYS
jgi:hypothetical protein